ncbi:MAG TPA: MFS transporter [Luteimonas sp.]|nr:MFS transporter [Luteimonas sp.]HRO26825.1 MFS transporter [Luteimonas sp.]HRP71663.1 MFS transporter [Luteimonas sp.]
MATSPASREHDQVHAAFVVAWLFCVIFYFLQYAMRSMPSVMIPELSAALGIDATAVGSLVGLYFYSYALFSLIAGAALDRWGAKQVIPAGVAMVALGAVLFGIGVLQAAQLGRLLQGAGSAFAFTGAVYLATHGFPARFLATAIGITQCFGMLGAAAGQFAVGPLIHGPIDWQQAWYYCAVGLVSIGIVIALASPHTPSDAAGRTPVWSMFAPYKVVLSNPQSWLCGVTAGLLFLPTTIGAQTWAVPFLELGLHMKYTDAVNHAATVSLGWVIGCPLLGYLADHFGRRKPVLLAGAVVAMLATAALIYLPADVHRPYSLGLLLGIASGAAMIPYTIIKEVNPDHAKGSATGAINFLVFTLSALLASLFGGALARLAGDSDMDLDVFKAAGWPLVAGVGLAIVLACFIRETGSAAKPGSE